MTPRPASQAPDGWQLGLSLMFVLLSEAGGLAQTALADDPAVAFERRPAGRQVIIGGRPFARYLYGTEAITRPFLESIHAPDGTQVTRDNPPVVGVDLADHPTFRPGLWLAFGATEGLWGGSLLAGLILAAPFGAVTATVSLYLVMIASGVVRDVYRRFLRPHAGDAKLRRLSHLAMAVVGAVGSPTSRPSSSSPAPAPPRPSWCPP